MRAPLLAVVLPLALAMGACKSRTLEPLPLDVTIQASKTTPAPGETVAFVVQAQGGQLFGVEISYGDAATDLFETGGARTARITFQHAYAAAGTYRARATVTDVVAGEKSTEVEIRVQ